MHHQQPAAADGERARAHDRPQALAQVGQPGAVEARSERQELLAAPAHQRLRGRDLVPQAAGQDAQHHIANGVALGVVDHLEVVDVDQHDADPGGRAEDGDDLVDPGVDATPVSDPRQLVGGAELVELGASPPQRLLLGGEAQRARHPGLQLDRFAGFAQVVVSPEVEPHGQVLGSDTGRQEDDRHMTQDRIHLHLLQGGEPVHHRHVDVEQDEIRVLRVADVDSVPAVRRFDHPMAGAFQSPAKDLADRPRVVDDQDGGHTDPTLPPAVRRPALLAPSVRRRRRRRRRRRWRG
jgi:hypothetical protein